MQDLSETQKIRESIKSLAEQHYLVKLCKFVFNALHTKSQFLKFRREMKNISTVFRQNVLKRAGLFAFKIERDRHVGSYRLEWVLTKVLSGVYLLAWNELIPEEPVQVTFGDFDQPVQESTKALEIQLAQFQHTALRKVARRNSKNLLRLGFCKWLSVVYGKENNMPFTTVDTWDTKGLSKLGGFTLDTQDEEVLNASPKHLEGSLRPLQDYQNRSSANTSRLNSYNNSSYVHASRNSRDLKQKLIEMRLDDVQKSGQSRLMNMQISPTASINLKIPQMSSLENSPFSPMSYGGLNTDRTGPDLHDSPEKETYYSAKSKRVAAEIHMLASREVLNSIWKGWRQHIMKRRIQRFKQGIADKNVFIKKAGAVFMVLLDGLKTSAARNRTARNNYSRRLRKRAFYAFRSVLQDEIKHAHYANMYYEQIHTKIFTAWGAYVRRKIETRTKLQMIEKRRNMRLLGNCMICLISGIQEFGKEKDQRQWAVIHWLEKMYRKGLDSWRQGIWKQKEKTNVYGAVNRLYNENLINRTWFAFCSNIHNSKRCTKQNTLAKDHYAIGIYRQFIFGLISNRYKWQEKRRKVQMATDYAETRRVQSTLITWWNAAKAQGQRRAKKELAAEFYVRMTLTRYFTILNVVTDNLKELRVKHDYFTSRRLISQVQRIFLDWFKKSETREEARVDLAVRVLKGLVSRCLNAWTQHIYQRRRRREMLQEACIYMNISRARNIVKSWKSCVVTKQEDKEAQIFSDLHYQKILFVRWLRFSKRNAALTNIFGYQDVKISFLTWAKTMMVTRLEFQTYKAIRGMRESRLVTKIFKAWNQYLKRHAYLISEISRFQKETGQVKLSDILREWRRVSLEIRKDSYALDLAKQHYRHTQAAYGLRTWFAFGTRRQVYLARRLRDYQITMLEHYSLNSKPKAQRYANTQYEKLLTVTKKAKGLRRWINKHRGKKEKIKFAMRIERLPLVPRLDKFEDGWRRMAVTNYATRRQGHIKKILAFWRDYIDTAKAFIISAETHNYNRVLKFTTIFFHAWNNRTLVKRQKNELIESMRSQTETNLLSKCLSAWFRLSAASAQESSRSHIAMHTLERQQMVRIFLSWQAWACRNRKHRLLIDNATYSRLAKVGFLGLFRYTEDVTQEREAKAEKHMQRKAIINWIDNIARIRQARLAYRQLSKKAIIFWEDQERFRALQNLNRVSQSRMMMKKAKWHYKQLQESRGIRRWASYHFRYLAKLRKARCAFQRKTEAKARRALLYWIKIGAKKSSNARIERRLFFFWDRHVLRILQAWRHLTTENKIPYSEKLNDFRQDNLLRKAMFGLRTAIQEKRRDSGIISKLSTNREENLAVKALEIIRKNAQINISKRRAVQHNRLRNLRRIFRNWVQFRPSGGPSKQVLLAASKQCVLSRVLSKMGDGSQIRAGVEAIGNRFAHSRFCVSPSYKACLFYKWIFYSMIRRHEKSAQATEHRYYLLTKRSLETWRKRLESSKMERRTEMLAIRYHRMKIKKRVFLKLIPRRNRHHTPCSMIHQRRNSKH